MEIEKTLETDSKDVTRHLSEIRQTLEIIVDDAPLHRITFSMVDERKKENLITVSVAAHYIDERREDVLDRALHVLKQEFILKHWKS